MPIIMHLHSLTCIIIRINNLIIKGGSMVFKKAITLILAVLLAVSLIGCQSKKSMDKIKQSGVLVLATSADYPPFESIDEKDGKTVIGFDVDIANAIAKKLNVKLEVKNIDFKGLLPALVEGKCDIIASGMAADDERRKSVDFSDVYFYDNMLLVVAEGNNSIKSITDLNGKKIGAQLSTTCEKIAQGIPGVVYKSMDKVDQLMLEVKNGRMDGVVVNLTVGGEYVKSIGGLKTIEIPELNVNPEGYAVAIAKGDTEFVKFVNGVIKDLKSSGEYDKLLAKWGLSVK